MVWVEPWSQADCLEFWARIYEMPQREAKGEPLEVSAADLRKAAELRRLAAMFRGAGGDPAEPRED